ncbi:MAG: hypothetical protein PGN26_14450 [Xylophilus ampelinus]
MPMTVLDAAYNVAHDYKGGAAALGARFGKNPTTFNHELAKVGSAKLGLVDAVKMTDFANDDRILIAWALHRGQMLVPLPDGADLDSDCSMQAMGAATQDFSSMVARVCEAKSDGKVTDNELRDVRQRIGVLVVGLQRLDQALAAENAALRVTAPIQSRADFLRGLEEAA